MFLLSLHNMTLHLTLDNDAKLKHGSNYYTDIDYVTCSMGLCISFKTCYDVVSEGLFSSSIHKYGISVLLRLSDFGHQFTESHLCYIQIWRCFFSKKSFSSLKGSLQKQHKIFLDITCK